jgi:hypothetical protein
MEIPLVAFEPTRTMNRRHHAVSLMQAAEASPPLARLAELTRDSSARLRAVEALIPPALRPSIKAGPLDGSNWCLLVSNTAAAAKLRQLIPSFEAVLRNQGWEVGEIRVKVQTPQSGQR